MTTLHHYRLIDNSSDELSMRSCLSACITEEGIKEIAIATGYWDVVGMALVVDELEQFLEREGTSLRLLIGKDPYVYASLRAQPRYKGKLYPDDYIRTDIQDLELKEPYQQVIALLLRYMSNRKIEARIYLKEFLHAKCYIFRGEKHSLGIIGSSNFTQKGLLGNSELNYLETDAMHVMACPVEGSVAKGHLCWFEEKWGQAEEWTSTFLEQVIAPSPIARAVAQGETFPLTPYELYIKLLYLQFGEVVDRALERKIGDYFPPQIKRYAYQVDAVKRCLAIMHEHGGFMLGDVVGLGKTIVATLLIRHFLSTPADDGRHRRVLIITPPAILAGWKDTVRRFFDNTLPPTIDFVTTGRLDALVEAGDLAGESVEVSDLSVDEAFAAPLARKRYGLIVIDESHKFRNANTQMYRALDELITAICSETGVAPYVGLLSATPQNNRPDDLKNQIYLFERDRNNSTLKKAAGGDLERFFSDIASRFEKLRKDRDDNETSREELNRLAAELRDGVLVDLLERRTRTDLRKFYARDLEAQGLYFPAIDGPHSIPYLLDDTLADLFADTMNVIASRHDQPFSPALGYYRYRAIEYLVRKADRARHAGRGNRDASHVSRELANLMQILLVKRLESSFAAFKESLRNLLRYTQNMIAMWNKEAIFVCPDIDVNKELQEKSIDAGIAAIRDKIKRLDGQQRNEQGTNREYTPADFDPAYYRLLQEDERILLELNRRWSAYYDDPKLETFKKSLAPELFDPKKNTSGKLVIFSEAKSTVKALARAVAAEGYRVLTITAANRDQEEETIRANFDANYPKEKWQDVYNVIITTEVLAEGVNLHRANVVVNYDTPWNATRLMQRIGRVNRIGSTAAKVYVYNFLPSAEGDAQIALVRKAYTKLQSFHVLFGEDSKIFSEAESLVHYDLPQRAEPSTGSWQSYLDGEESEAQRYIDELRRYREQHPFRYAQIIKAKAGCEIAQRRDGTAYFVLKATHGPRLAFKIAPPLYGGQAKPQAIALRELIDLMRVDETATSEPLPPDWGALADVARRGYRQHSVRIPKSSARGSRDALDHVMWLYGLGTLSSVSKQLLEKARRWVDNGNTDIIRGICALARDIPPLATGEQIDQLLTQRLAQQINALPEVADIGDISIELGTMK